MPEIGSFSRFPRRGEFFLSPRAKSVRACVRRAQCTRRALDVDPPLRPLGVCRRPATPDCARARVRVPGRVGHVVFCCSTHDASIPRRHRASFAAPASSHALHVHLIPLASFLFVRSPPSPRPRKGGRTSYGLAAWWKPLPGMERIHARSERPSNIRVIISVSVTRKGEGGYCCLCLKGTIPELFMRCLFIKHELVHFH